MTRSIHKCSVCDTETFYEICHSYNVFVGFATVECKKCGSPEATD